MEKSDSRPRMGGNVSPRSMDIASRANTSGAQLASQPQSVQPAKKPTRARWFIGVAIVVVALGAIIAIVLSLQKNSINGAIDTNGYQAVFLNDGQAYFGKLHILNSEYMKITDVYFIQGKASATNPQQSSTTVNTSNIVELVRLTNAVHGPKDAMIIDKNQVSYFENLSSDGQAAKLIASDKAKQ